MDLHMLGKGDVALKVSVSQKLFSLLIASIVVCQKEGERSIYLKIGTNANVFRILCIVEIKRGDFK